MSYAVDFYEGGVKLGSGTVNAHGHITDFEPYQGRGLAHRRQVQVAVTSGKHTGASITAQVHGQTGDNVTLLEPMPFQGAA